MPELVNEFGGNISKHLRRQTNLVDTLEFGNGDQQAIQTGFAWIGLEAAEGDAPGVFVVSFVGIGIVFAQQSVDRGFAACA